MSKNSGSVFGSSAARYGEHTKNTTGMVQDYQSTSYTGTNNDALRAYIVSSSDGGANEE